MSGGFFLITAAEEGSIVVLEATMVRSEVSMHAGGGVKEGRRLHGEKGPEGSHGLHIGPQRCPQEIPDLSGRILGRSLGSRYNRPPQLLYGYRMSRASRLATCLRDQASSTSCVTADVRSTADRRGRAPHCCCPTMRCERAR